MCIYVECRVLLPLLLLERERESQRGGLECNCENQTEPNRLETNQSINHAPFVLSPSLRDRSVALAWLSPGVVTGTAVFSTHPSPRPLFFPPTLPSLCESVCVDGGEKMSKGG